jgi:hypothetical protein
MDGKLYRPAQDCTRTYGGRVVLHEITALDRTSFEEEQVAVVEPDPAGPYPLGLHTFSPLGQAAFIDGKRSGLSPWLLGRNVRRRVSALSRSVPVSGR